MPGLKERADLYIEQVRDFKKANMDRTFQWNSSEHYQVKNTSDIWTSYDEAHLQQIQMMEHLEDNAIESRETWISS